MTRPHRRRLRGLERASAWLLTPVVVALVPVTAFEAYALHSRLTPTSYERGGAFGAGSGPSSPVPSSVLSGPAAARATAATPAEPGAPSAAAAPSSAIRSSAAVVATAAPPSNGGRGPTHAPAASAPPAHGPTAATISSGGRRPRTGTYALAVSGTESAKFGPIGVCSQTLPQQATLTVGAAPDDSPTSYDFDLRFYPGQPDKHDERHIYRYSATQVLLDYEQATVTCGGVKQSTTLPYSPPQVRAELPLAIGKTWRNHGGSSDRTEDATSTVTGTDAVTVGGTAYPVYVIKTDITMSGPENGTRTQAWWYSPDLAMPLRIYEKISAHKSGGTFNNEYTATVTSLPS